MTVEELITCLQQVEDKTREVRTYDGELDDIRYLVGIELEGDLALSLMFG